MDKPPYILNFQKPKNTEIKHINGHWYLYERYSVYDPVIKRSRKKSGKIIGRITENGLIQSREKTGNRPSICHDIVEVGAVNFFYGRTVEMRERLKHCFPDLWQQIYIIAIVRAIYDCRFKRLQLHYEDSALSYVYPGVSFSARSVSALLSTLGRQRNGIENYMKESVSDDERFLLFDGHRLLSASCTMDNAELGYDSKRRYKPQINLIYMFSMGKDTGCPVYYKQFIGSTPDVTAFSDILKESGSYGRDCTVVADKGFTSEEDITLIEGSSLKYILPLKRGNKYAKDRLPESPAGYDEAFSFNGRGIQSATFHEEEFNIHIFFDADLFAQEMSDLTKRTEKKNNSIQVKKEQEAQRRANGKGRLTDEELASLAPLCVKDMYEDKKKMGTITVKTNRKELNSFQVYCIYKQRQAVEQFFKTYGDTMSFESSYMRDNYSEEAWLFLNHLSSIICINAIEEIASIKESKNVSYKDLTQTLIKIKANYSDGKWSVVPIKKAVQNLCKKLKYDPVDLSGLNL